MNSAFAGVSTGLLHRAQTDALVLCHHPARTSIRGLPERPMPGLAECLAANLQVARLTSPGIRAAGVCLNTASSSVDEARRLCGDTSHLLGLPCTDPYRFGVEAIIDNLLCHARSEPAQIASR